MLELLERELEDKNVGQALAGIDRVGMNPPHRKTVEDPEPDSLIAVCEIVLQGGEVPLEGHLCTSPSLVFDFPFLAAVGHLDSQEQLGLPGLAFTRLSSRGDGRSHLCRENLNLDITKPGRDWGYDPLVPFFSGSGGGTTAGSGLLAWATGPWKPLPNDP